MFWDEPRQARLVAPDLTRLAHSHSDAALAAILAFIRSEPVDDGAGDRWRWQLPFGSGLPFAEDIGRQAARLDPGQSAQPLVCGRQLGLMAKVAVKRFAHFTDAEIAALHGLLCQRAGLPTEP